jgi:hypothetical protein
MKRYLVPNDPETLAALSLLSTGVVSIELAKDFSHSHDCHSCCLELEGGRWIQLQATGEDLEYKFEVFPLHARQVDAPRTGERHAISLTAPVAVTPLATESWLDPIAPTGPTLGSDPVSQFVGLPSSVPSTASASCRYVGGVELKGANGITLVVATGGFPYSLHVSGFYEDRGFRRGDYVALSAEA